MRLLIHKCFEKKMLSPRLLPEIRFSSSFLPDVDHIKRFLKELGLTREQYRGLLPKTTSKKSRQFHVIQAAEMIQKLGFTKTQILEMPEILKTHPFTIDLRYKALEECGVPVEEITLEKIRRYKKYCHKTINELKRISLIKGDVDVKRNILSFSDLPSDLYLSLSATDEDKSLTAAQASALQYYLCWKFDLKKEEVERKYFSYEFLHNKSIRIMMQCYEVLVTKVGLPDEKIMKNFYLLHSHPDQFIDIIERVPMIGDKPVRTVVRIRPKLLMRPTYKLLEAIKILEEYKVSPEAISTTAEMLTYSPMTIKQRLEYLTCDPLFKLYLTSRYFGLLVRSFPHAIARVKLLEDVKWQCPTLRLLSCYHQDLFKKIKHGLDTHRGHDIIDYFYKELGVDRKQLHQALDLHPFYRYISLKPIVDCYEYLVHAGFTKSQITDAIQILLYPKSQIEDSLQGLQSQPGLECCCDETGALRQELKLNLVLYFLEQPFKFSGNGVWAGREDSIKDLDIEDTRVMDRQ